MATTRTVIEMALRKLRVVASGETPNPDEAADALQALQSLYVAWVSGGMFGRLTNRVVSDEYTAGENQRIRVDAGGSVVLPTLIETCCGDERAPRNRAVVIVVDTVNGTTQTHLYDGASGGWIALEGLKLDDEAPLSNRDLDGLACCLAEALADEYGATLGGMTQKRAAGFRVALSSGFDDPSRSVEVQYF